jgi:hypothetical protein
MNRRRKSRERIEAANRNRLAVTSCGARGMDRESGVEGCECSHECPIGTGEETAASIATPRSPTPS